MEKKLTQKAAAMNAASSVPASDRATLNRKEKTAQKSPSPTKADRSFTPDNFAGGFQSLQFNRQPDS